MELKDRQLDYREFKITRHCLGHENSIKNKTLVISNNIKMQHVNIKIEI